MQWSFQGDMKRSMVPAAVSGKAGKKESVQGSMLTPRQLQILRMISEYRFNRGYSPTMGELSEELCISRSTVFGHIGELRKKGHLTASRGKARSLRLTAKGEALRSVYVGPPEVIDNSAGRSTRRQAGAQTNQRESAAESIRVVGQVSAGVPIEAIEDKEQVSLDSFFGDPEELFAVKVSGESMIDEGIQDGDYVICRKSVTAENGQLVVAGLEDNEVTLKKFYRGKAEARLQPANDNYEPIMTGKCRICGVVVGLLRNI